jgi:hypothetical protein
MRRQVGARLLEKPQLRELSGEHLLLGNLEDLAHEVGAQRGESFLSSPATEHVAGKERQV